MKLDLHPDKYSLFLTKVELLGYMVMKEGIHSIDRLVGDDIKFLRGCRFPSEHVDEWRFVCAEI
jgi:hypothetical protein